MTSHVKVEHPVDGLISYHYFRTPTKVAELPPARLLRLIGDSGAFSSYSQGITVDLAEYAAWIRDNGTRFAWTASLDVLYDPDATWRNWTRLRDRHHVDTVPTIHLGSDPSVIDRYAAEGVDYMGLGGLVGKPRPVCLRWALHVMRYARDRHPHMRFHAWGVGYRDILDQLPVYSADSSGTTTKATRFGQIVLFDPRTQASKNIKLDGKGNVNRWGTLLRTTYGVDPNDIGHSHAGNRTTLIQLAVASTQQYAGWLRRRFKVTAPASLGPDAPVGPRVHVVETSSSDFRRITGQTVQETRA